LRLLEEVIEEPFIEILSTLSEPPVILPVPADKVPPVIAPTVEIEEENVAAPAFDISRVRAVIKLPLSFPINIISPSCTPDLKRILVPAFSTMPKIVPAS
jgi:hypothetical protein